MTNNDWASLTDTERDLLASANIKPTLVDTHAAIAPVLAEVAEKQEPKEPKELVFDLAPGKDTWRVVGPTRESPPHEAPNPLADKTFVEKVAALRKEACRGVCAGTPEAAEQEALVGGIARALGVRLTSVLFSEQARADVVRAINTIDAGRPRLSVRVAGAGENSDRALALPWELLTPEPGEFPVRMKKLDVVREAVTEGAPTLPDATEPLTLTVSIAAPEDESSLRYESEALRLYRSLVPLGHRVAFADLGDVDDLLRTAEAAKPSAIHFSGHGLPGRLVFEDELGLAKVLKVSDLVEKLRLKLAPSSSGGERFPKLFFLASCHGASKEPAPAFGSPADGCLDEAMERHNAALDRATGHGPSTAAELHRNGFTQVVGYFGPISDALCTRAEEAFYSSIAKGKTTLQATAEARSQLDEEQENGELRFPFAWTQLALYHRGPDRPLARPGTLEETPPVGRFQLKTEDVSGLPVLEMGFIGRRSLQHLVRRKVEKESQRLVVLQGLGGLGKTALAIRLIGHVFAREPADALILTCKELDPKAGDPASALWKQAEKHGERHRIAGWEEAMRALRASKPEPTPAAGFEETVRLLREARPMLVVYADNMETLQRGPASAEPGGPGAWLPEALACWEALERIAGEVRLVMVSTRYGWRDLDPNALVPIEPMRPADVLRMIEAFPELGGLPRSIQERIAVEADGHPRTVEYLDALVKAQRIGLGPGFEVKDPWAELLEPVLPKGAQRITEDLLLYALWTRLSEGARRHARALRVLWRPAPKDVIDALGSSETTGELIEAGVLTRFREQSSGEAGTLEWVDRWGMHSIIGGFVSGLAEEEEVEKEAHQAAGIAYEAWIEQPGARWLEQEEGIAHLLEAEEGDRAWPMVQEYALWLRGRARFREALSVLRRCEAAGTSGERLSSALQLLVQMRVKLGERSTELEVILVRALNLAESEERRASVLHEQGVLLEEQGKYAEAETLLRRSLAVEEKALGVAHPSNDASLQALAIVLQHQGRYAEAETLLRQSLAINEKALGVADPSYSASLHNLAGVLQNQGRYAEAETLLRQSLAIDEKALGVAHPSYSTSLHDLAGVLQDQGKYAEAETLLRQSLAIDEKTLGAEHPFYGSSLHALASVLEDQGKYEEAETLVRQSLALKEKALGVAHPDLYPTLVNLADILARRKQAAEAETLAERALRIVEDTHGSHHPDTARILSILARIQAKLGKSEARETARRALETLVETLGADHPTTKDAAPILQRIAAGGNRNP